MTVKIFKAELDAGLESLIESSASIAYASLATPHSPDSGEEERAKLLAFSSEAGANPDQFDLYYLTSVLVSTGWNKNDDVFDLAEVWAARNTPEDKQFNFMHDESDIIGHITGNKVVNENGVEISDEVSADELPEKFDIVTSAVLYNSWADPERKERMSSIIEEIEAGEWFVSMECLFKGFDYAVVDTKGQHKIIARDEESAFLTKHLRVYGGEGEYEGHKLGRLLKNISFSGKGLVEHPANPRSVILNNLNKFRGSKTYSISYSDIRENVAMANEDLLQKQIEELKSDLAQAKEDAKSLEETVATKNDVESQARIETFEAAITEKDRAIDGLSDEITAAQDALASSKEELAAKDEELAGANSKIEAHEAEFKTMLRKTALVEAGLEGEDIETALEKFSGAADDIFDEVVSLYSKMKGNPFFDKLKKKKKDDEEDKDSDASLEATEESDDDTTDSTDEAEAEADAEILENVEETEEVALTDAGDTDTVAETRAGVSNWLSKNVLHTTSGLEEN
jgi:uncharacterized coiled-coil protein SlyX